MKRTILRTKYAERNPEIARLEAQSRENCKNLQLHDEFEKVLDKLDNQESLI